MPGGLFEADAAFPALSKPGSTEEKLQAVQDYLYLLLETLRWTLRHLSEENFDGAGASALVERVVKEAPDVFNTIVSNVVISNTVITNELCADYGAIADLTVDELRTDYRKAARYLAGNTAAMDYLYIHDEQIDFLTGPVKLSGGLPLTEQLHRRNRFFWWTDDTRTQMTSLEDTGLPVTVYQYDELLKGSFRFGEYTHSGGVTMIPTLILGAGSADPRDPDVGKGFLRKDTDSLDLWLHGAETDKGLFIGAYTDLMGLRKPTQLDFSDWDGGSFSETLDGGVTHGFHVGFDESGYPVLITDADGHETEVLW